MPFSQKKYLLQRLHSSETSQTFMLGDVPNKAIID